MKNNRKYGGKPPKRDIRDYKLAKFICPLPESFSLSNLPRVKDQENVRSCVAHAMSSIMEYFEQGKTDLSTNFIYGIQKKICGYSGTGMYLQNACKIAQKYGDMLEKDCPGNDEVPVCCKKAEKAFADKNKSNTAYVYKVKNYFNCKDFDDIKKAIYRYGPVLGSVKWYDDYQCDKNGVLFRDSTKKSNYGYHTIMIYGWTKEGFLCQNSWGENWGNKGRFILPYSIPLAEAKGFADADNNMNIIVPKVNKVVDTTFKKLDRILQLLNFR